jgi:hypothetical protein
MKHLFAISELYLPVLQFAIDHRPLAQCCRYGAVKPLDGSLWVLHCQAVTSFGTPADHVDGEVGAWY